MDYCKLFDYRHPDQYIVKLHSSMLIHDNMQYKIMLFILTVVFSPQLLRAEDKDLEFLRYIFLDKNEKKVYLISRVTEFVC